MAPGTACIDVDWVAKSRKAAFYGRLEGGGVFRHVFHGEQPAIGGVIIGNRLGDIAFIESAAGCFEGGFTALPRGGGLFVDHILHAFREVALHDQFAGPQRLPIRHEDLGTRRPASQPVLVRVDILGQ